MAVPKRRKSLATTKPTAKSSAKPPAKSPHKSPPKKSTEVAITVPVDRALKAAWDKQKAIIEEASREDMRAWDRKYEAVAAIASHDPPLYLAGSFADFASFVREFLREEVRVVRDWTAVALRASPDEERLYTPTRLALLLSMLRAQSKDESLPKKVEWAKLKVPLVKNGALTGKSKSALDASLDEIRAARRAAMQAKTPTVKRDGKEAATMREALKGDALKSVKVQYRDGMYSFGAVPGYAMADFARALLAAEKSDKSEPSDERKASTGGKSGKSGKSSKSSKSGKSAKAGRKGR